MKNTTLIAATLALTTLSFGTMAATEVQNLIKPLSV